MIQNNQELEVTLARIRHFQKQIENSEKSKPIHGIINSPSGTFSPKLIG